MHSFIKNIDKGLFQVEFKVDSKIFSLNTVMKAAYEMIDRVYMFMKIDTDNDILVQFKLKKETLNLDQIVDSFGEELVYHKLRADIAQKTGDLRERIIQTALGFGLTLNDIKEDLYSIGNGANITMAPQQPEPATRSIEDIISDIETDPDFAEDKDDIISILKEIQTESKEDK